MDQTCETYKCKLNNNTESDELIDVHLDKRENIFESKIHFNADEYILKYIKFYTKCNYTTQEFLQMQTNSTFEIKIGGCELTKCDLDFLFEISNVKHYENLIIVEPPNYLLTKIPLIAMKNQDARIIITTNENLIKCIYCKFNYTYLDAPIKTHLSKNPVTIFTQTTTCDTKNYIEWSDCNENYFVCDISNANLTKGYFIYGDVNLISSLQIKINGYDRFSKYDKCDIDIVCDKITDKLLFLPYSNATKLNYKNNNLDSFVGASKVKGSIKIIMSTLNNACTTKKFIKIYPLIGLHVSFDKGLCTIKNYEHQTYF